MGTLPAGLSVTQVIYLTYQRINQALPAQKSPSIRNNSPSRTGPGALIRLRLLARWCPCPLMPSYPDYDTYGFHFYGFCVIKTHGRSRGQEWWDRCLR